MTDAHCHCLVCPTFSSDPDADGWTNWQLPADIHWRSAFTHNGEEPPLPAGSYWTCPPCTAWVPNHRAGHLPSVALQGIHALLDQPLQPSTRRRLHAEAVGRLRHIAAQLVRPGDDGQ